QTGSPSRDSAHLMKAAGGRSQAATRVDLRYDVRAARVVDPKLDGDLRERDRRAARVLDLEAGLRLIRAAAVAQHAKLQVGRAQSARRRLRTERRGRQRGLRKLGAVAPRRVVPARGASEREPEARAQPEQREV